MGMPSRHISPQSFDEILSELGDDPAIPDPHGIRKSKPLKSGAVDPSTQNENSIRPDSFIRLNSFQELKKFSGFFTLIACVIGVIMALFLGYESLKTHSKATVEDAQRQISELKKELAILYDEVQDYREDLYEEIEILEVSIHSLKENKAKTKIILKPQAIPYEPELRRWRFLGASQMGNSHRALFHTGNGSSSFEKGMIVLGDWRLSHIEKDMANLTHPQGKSLVLKAFKSE